MPVILGNQNSIDMWLSNTTPELATVAGPYEEPDLVWHPVTPTMGKLSFNGPECIQEIQLKCATETPLLKFFSKKIDNKGQLKEEPENSQEFPGADSPDRVKEEPADEENNSKSESIIPSEKETVKPDICGAKHELEEIKTGSGLTTEMFDMLHPDPPKKKSKNLKSVSDGQASLLAYFGKR